MWYFCGFNGFKQFGKAHANKVNQLTEFELNSFDKKALVRPAWSYNVVAAGDQIFLSGFAENNEAQLDAEVLSLPSHIADVSISDMCCLILLDSGRLFKLTRSNMDLQEVKFADVAIVSTRKRKIFKETPDREELVTPTTIKHIACGSNLAVAICTCNGVYNIPTKVHQFPANEKVVSLQCGFEHAVVLNSNGDVYTWGNGLRGQLGSGEIRVQETPILVEALAGIKIISIAASGWHTAAVSSFGDVYTWGFNCNGQLGIRVFKTNGVKNPSVYPLPQIIDLPKCCALESSESAENSCDALAVYCGARHTIVKMACGALIASGWNTYGQLGLGDFTEMVDEFQMLPDLPEGDVNVICGPWNTLFKIDQKIR